MGEAGKVVQVMGPVVDVEFPPGDLPEMFTRRDAFTKIRNTEVQKVGDMEPALELLEELGYIRPAPDETPRPGRPSVRFEVNPKWIRRQ